MHNVICRVTGPKKHVVLFKVTCHADTFVRKPNVGQNTTGRMARAGLEASDPL